ncbi:hypothetical protein Vadar_034755 [Vaccinium darrowii]|uniref:Uncharacterized protein n=1 Tax=Vaccinium darrowii TaxID=229202 RepID=A0ACB7Y5I0_9ERIC|nr:hypothetical protein Vadar_034755 [Vaccinium darrowii]
MSSTSTNSRFQGPCCGCGVPAPLRSSNQDPNRGRRFFGCINYKQPTACGFFLWLDPERDMEKELIQAENQVLKREVQALTKKNEKLRKKYKEAEAKVSGYHKIFFGVLVVFLVLWLATTSNSSSEQQQRLTAAASNNRSEQQQQRATTAASNSEQQQQ